MAPEGPRWCKWKNSPHLWSKCNSEHACWNFSFLNYVSLLDCESVRWPSHYSTSAKKCQVVQRVPRGSRRDSSCPERRVFFFFLKLQCLEGRAVTTRRRQVPQQNLRMTINVHEGTETTSMHQTFQHWRLNKSTKHQKKCVLNNNHESFLTLKDGMQLCVSWCARWNALKRRRWCFHSSDEQTRNKRLWNLVQTDGMPSAGLITGCRSDRFPRAHNRTVRAAVAHVASINITD